MENMESDLADNKFYMRKLNALKSAIKDEDNQIKARKCLRVGRWLKANIELIEDFDEKKLKFLSDIFSDDSCWDGIKLKHKVVGEELIKERNRNGRENPFNLSNRYYLACKYCLEDKIPALFEQIYMKPENDICEKDISVDKLRSKAFDYYRRRTPIKTYWTYHIDKQSGKLKEYNPVEGLLEAIQVNSYRNWEEGIEFFFNKMQDNPNNSNESDLLIYAALSGVKGYANVDVIEFCLSKMSDDLKKVLLEEDLEENEYYAILNELSYEFCFDSFTYLFELLLRSDKLKIKDCIIFLSLLSDQVLHNPDLSQETKNHMMNIWRYIIKMNESEKYKNMQEHEESIFNNSNLIHVIVNLIVALSRESRNYEEKGMGLLEEILKRIDDEEIERVKNSVSKKLKERKEFREVNLQFLEQLFSDIGIVSKSKISS